MPPLLAEPIQIISTDSSDGEGEGEEVECPLCMEEMDLSDQYFKPCPCGYQVCRFCWHRIREGGNQSCPACRRIYTDEVEFTPVPPEALARASALKKARKERREAAFARIAAVNVTSSPSQAPPVNSGSSQPSLSSLTATKISSQQVDIVQSRKAIADFRVVQRNLVYIIGIAQKIAAEATLRSFEFCGQYGPIVKLVVNKRVPGASSLQSGSSASAYVTYAKKEDAAKAIAGIDGSVYDGRVIRATYGTTKYCSFFLRALPCPNAGCMYLHEQGDLTDSYTKEQLAVGNHHLHSFLVEGSMQQKFKRFGEIQPLSSMPTTAIPSAPSVVPSSSSIIIGNSASMAVEKTPEHPHKHPVFDAGDTERMTADAEAFFERLLAQVDTAKSNSILKKDERTEDDFEEILGSGQLGGEPLVVKMVCSPSASCRTSRPSSPPPPPSFYQFLSNEPKGQAKSDAVVFGSGRPIDAFFNLFRSSTTDGNISSTNK